MHQMTFARFCRVGPCQILWGNGGRVRDGIYLFMYDDL